jgi:MFS family permease
MKKHLIVSLVLFSFFLSTSSMAAVGRHWGNQDAQWWSVRSAALIGGLGGGLIGIFGGALGISAGCLVPRGRARGFIVGSAFSLAGFGLAILVAGVVAVFASQPYHVYYPLLLGGLILVLVFGVNAFIVRRCYLEIELRQMSAKDA